MSISFVPLGISILVLVAAAVQHLGTVGMKGVGFVMTDRSQPLPESGFSGRSRRALQNTVESAAMMVPPALLIVISGQEIAFVQVAGAVYLGARVVFLLCYWFAWNRLRSVSWGIGMAAILATAGAALSVLPLTGLS